MQIKSNLVKFNDNMKINLINKVLCYVQKNNIMKSALISKIGLEYQSAVNAKSKIDQKDEQFIHHTF